METPEFFTDKTPKLKKIRESAMYFAGLLIVSNPEAKTMEVASIAFDLARMMDFQFETMKNATESEDARLQQIWLDKREEVERASREKAVKR